VCTQALKSRIRDHAWPGGRLDNAALSQLVTQLKPVPSTSSILRQLQQQQQPLQRHLGPVQRSSSHPASPRHEHAAGPLVDNFNKTVDRPSLAAAAEADQYKQRVRSNIDGLQRSAAAAASAAEAAAASLAAAVAAAAEEGIEYPQPAAAAANQQQQQQQPEGAGEGHGQVQPAGNQQQQQQQQQPEGAGAGDGLGQEQPAANQQQQPDPEDPAAGQQQQQQQQQVNQQQGGVAAAAGADISVMKFCAALEMTPQAAVLQLPTAKFVIPDAKQVPVRISRAANGQPVRAVEVAGEQVGFGTGADAEAAAEAAAVSTLGCLLRARPCAAAGQQAGCDGCSGRGDGSSS